MAGHAIKEEAISQSAKYQSGVHTVEINNAPEILNLRNSVGLCTYDVMIKICFLLWSLVKKKSTHREVVSLETCISQRLQRKQEMREAARPVGRQQVNAFLHCPWQWLHSAPTG